MSLHEGSKFLHIGCDEVFHMAECEVCSRKPKDGLFLSHVHRVASYVTSKYKVKPIIWDDMLRHMTAAALDDAKLGDLVEPMVWVRRKLFLCWPCHHHDLIFQLYLMTSARYMPKMSIGSLGPTCLSGTRRCFRPFGYQAHLRALSGKPW